MSSPDEWYRSLPLVTKAYFTAACATTLLLSTGIISALPLYLDHHLVMKRFQLWRLFSNYLFFGQFSMSFVFQIVLLVRYFRELESNYYAGLRGTGDLLFLILFGTVSLNLVSLFVYPIPFLGPSLVFMIIYIWSRKDPYRSVVMYGFSFRAWHTPFIFVCISVLLGNSPVMDLMGIGVGHAYYFLHDVVPRVYNTQILQPAEDLWFKTFVTRYICWHGEDPGNPTGGMQMPGVVQPPGGAPAAPVRDWQRGVGHRLDQ